MKRTTIFRVIIAACIFAASLFIVSGAMATTESECVSGGGTVSAGSGCKFCVGGKFDLSEITEAGKNGTTRSGSEQKTDRNSGQPGAAPGSKAPADNRM